MPLPRFRLRSLLIAVAVVAVLAVYAGPAGRRWRDRWRRLDHYGYLERQHLDMAAEAGGASAEHHRRLAEIYGRRKWHYRYAVLRFWEPLTSDESTPDEPEPGFRFVPEP